MCDCGKTDQQGNAIQKPDVVLEYNNVIGAVDKVDQMLEPYAVQQKGVKWYIRVTAGLTMKNNVSSKGVNVANKNRFFEPCELQKEQFTASRIWMLMKPASPQSTFLEKYLQNMA